MRIRRLGWAGLEIEADGALAVVDLLEDMGPLAAFVGEAREPLPAFSRPGEAEVALVTHLHGDHADPPAIARALAPGAELLRPRRADGEGLETIALAGAEAGLAEQRVAQREVEPWQTVTVGPFEVTAVPAVDGFGDPQVSWAIAADGCRILHAGDTLFHGSWWIVRMRLGPFDAVFLPVNGPVCDFPHRQPPSPLAAAMDPRQAAAAATILEARRAVPIHYDAIHKPPVYAQVDDPAPGFLAAAEELGVPARVVPVGDELVLEPADARA